MIPSDHFVRFYNEVFKFLDSCGGLEPYYKEISRHQELHCLDLFRKKGLKGIYEYYNRIKHEENCVLNITLEDDKLTSVMERCPSLSKVLDNDAAPCEKYCDHCSGWSIPLYTKCGIYYVQNMMGRTIPSCTSVRTCSKEIAEKTRTEFLKSGVPEELINSNLSDWEEVERNKRIANDTE